MKRKSKYLFVLLAVLSPFTGNAEEGKSDGLRSIDFFEAFYVASQHEKDYKPYQDSSLMFSSDRPLLSLSQIKFRIDEGKKPSIGIKLEREAVSRLNKTLAGNDEAQIALVKQGQVVFSAKLKGPLEGEWIQLTFKDHQSFAELSKLLQQTGIQLDS